MPRVGILLALLGLCGLAAAAQSELRALLPLCRRCRRRATAARASCRPHERPAIALAQASCLPRLPHCTPAAPAPQTTPACSRLPTPSLSASTSAAVCSTRCRVWTSQTAPACRRRADGMGWGAWGSARHGLWSRGRRSSQGAVPPGSTSRAHPAQPTKTARRPPHGAMQLMVTDGDSVIIRWEGPAGAPGNTLSLMTCFSNASAVDRPWRKANPVISVG